MSTTFGGRIAVRIGTLALLACFVSLPAGAQSDVMPPVPVAPSPVTPWGAAVDVDPTQPAAKGNNSTVIERAGGGKAGLPGVRLMALLTADGQQIDQGLVWRVFQGADARGKAKLVTENREASPQLKLQPGDYTINCAFGRAHLTKKISVKADAPITEQFVLNAGGLRLTASANGKPAVPGAVTYTVYADDRDQSGNRTAMMTNAKPNLILRLNAGIYRLSSTYGDANAVVETDVTVEAGKLTEAAVAHAAGRAMFKLVTRVGGEAIPDTAWSVQSTGGEVIKETVGALPSHYLAPGNYRVAARSGGQIYKSEFTVKDGETSVVEVLMDAKSAAPVETIDPTAESEPPAELGLDGTGSATDAGSLFDLKSR